MWRRSLSFVGENAWEGMNQERRSRAALLMRQNRSEWDALMTDRTTLQEWSRSTPSRTLFVSAADTWPPLRELVGLFKKGCPHWSFAEVPRGGHMAPLYRPELVNPIIVDFLSR